MNIDEHETVLKVENLSKIYRLGQIGTGTISHDLNRWWAKMRGKEDPFSTVGVTNDRSQKDGTNEYVKVLNDINFEVKKGEVIGIIGKNGAGKSTLLKVISQITSPSTGSIKAKGRIASLLEVGTGMHPEMTGKENVYLNGTILGMTRKEVDAKYDEIMEFAGCAKYAYTPVKRYSSGMKVRLGFAVAAFLEPEILIVDEVLAVGDAEFQKKAIGKMQDISAGGGRTVLFVSHNMVSIQELCKKVLILDQGEIKSFCDVHEGINLYLRDQKESSSKYINCKLADTKSTGIEYVSIINDQENELQKLRFGDAFRIKIIFRVTRKIRNPIVSVRLSNSSNVNIITWRSNDYKHPVISNKFDIDSPVIILELKKLLLLDDVYKLSIGFADGKEILEVVHDAISFEIMPGPLNENMHLISKKRSSNSILYHEANWRVS